MTDRQIRRQITLREMLICISVFCLSLGLMSLQYRYGSPFPMSARVLFVTACFASGGGSIGYPLGRLLVGTKRGALWGTLVLALLSGLAGFLFLLYVLFVFGFLRVS
jgi:hypothetical protein